MINKIKDSDIERNLAVAPYSLSLKLEKLPAVKNSLERTWKVAVSQLKDATRLSAVYACIHAVTEHYHTVSARVRKREESVKHFFRRRK